MHPSRTPLKFRSAAATSALVLVGLLVVGQVPVAARAAAGKKDQNPPAKLNVDETPLSRDVKAGTSFAAVVKKVAPSVVNIYSTTIVRERPFFNPFLSDPFWRQFFGAQPTEPDQPRIHKEQGLGSGVIVSAEGYILTANHVVEGADSVKVGLASGEKEFDAKVVGTDPPTDVAVLKIEPHKALPAMTLADSDKLEVGDMVLAVGNPFAVGQTVTLGIISGLGRGGFGISGYEDFIQTDAAINPGNSGGALVDAQGRLVGINTAIVTRSGGYQGVGFAVPINLARFALDSLIRDGKVTRGYLGINPQTLTPELARLFNLPEDTAGVLATEVMPNSPADKAGLKEGDVITEINGKKLGDSRNLRLLTAQTPPGTSVNVRLLRGGQPGHKPTEHNLAAKLAELPEETAAPVRGSRAAPQRRHAEHDSLDGVEVEDLDGRARRQFDIPPNVRGALVVGVDPDSNAAQAKLRPGDVILEIDRHPVANAQAAVDLSEKAPGDQILLRVWRRSGGTRYVPVDNIKHK
jgi:serine protease Do